MNSSSQRGFRIATSLFAFAAALPIHAAAPLGPAFTFQGRLTDSGLPANGTFNMDFRLFDDEVTPPGVQIGGVISLSVPVTDGLFTVELNDADQFGLSAFDGDERWLEITVNGTALTPRQLITAAPYAQSAIEALSVAGIDGHSLDAADGVPVDALIVDNAGNAGIGTAAPERRLHVFDGSAGAVTSNSNASLVVEDSATAYMNFLTPDANESGILFGSPANAANGGILFNTSTALDGLVFRTGGNATRMAIDSAGAVGIGTTTPGMELDVRSTATSAAGQVRAGNSNADTWLMLWSGFTNGSNDPAIIWSDDLAGDDLRFLTSSSAGSGGGEHMRITGAGNVGIGTSSPQVPLHVVGEVRAQGIGNRFASRNPDNTNAIFQLDWHDHPTDPLQNVARLRLGGSGDGAGNGIAFQGGGDVEWMRITTAGNVGIGTTTPASKLDVAGSIHATAVDVTGTIDATSVEVSGDINVAGTIQAGGSVVTGTRFADDFTNGGGIAITRQTGPAQFVGAEVTYDGTSLKLLAGNTTGGSLPATSGISIDNAGNIGLGEVIDFIPSDQVLFLRNSAGTATIELDADETDASAIRLSNAAGTGTIILDADIGGNGRVTTQELQITGGSDLSEQFDVAGALGRLPDPGTVVCIDPANPGRLVVSCKSYDRTVAGVISGAGGVRPGMLMSQQGSAADGAHPVALTGRVYAWCDAADGAIEPGDLLTTSGTPGHAMKVVDHGAAQGAILGKAMSPLANGRGLVLVLVSLQ